MENFIIKAPKFKVKVNGKYFTVNEYTLRNLQILHFKKECVVFVKCANGYKSLDEKGYLPEHLKGLDIADNLAIKLHKLTLLINVVII